MRYDITVHIFFSPRMKGFSVTRMKEILGERVVHVLVNNLVEVGFNQIFIDKIKIL